MARGHLTSFIYTSVSIPGLLFQEEAWQHHDQHQQQQEWQQQQQPCNDRTDAWCFTLRFPAVSKVAMAPFARLSASQQSTPQELFLLSRLSSSSSEPLTSSGAGSSSGYESETDTDSGAYSSDLHLDRINCQICKRPLNQPGSKKRWPWGRSSSSSSNSSNSSKGMSSEFLVCDCCQRCYHKHCCKQQGISTRERDGVWFHDSSCRECLQKLQDKVASGASKLPGGRNWQLIDCAPVDGSGPGGVKALQALKQHLSDVLEVMLPAFGPGAAQQLVDTSKGYALLLKKGKEPLTAGLLDVYGRELAVLDLVATTVTHKGEGHCRALLQALEGWLGPDVGVAKLVAVCPNDDAQNLQVWQQKFGFKALDGRALKSLQSAVPALSYYEESTFLSKPLKHKRKSSSSSSSQKQGKAAKGDAKQADQQQDEGQPKSAELPVQPLEA